LALGREATRLLLSRLQRRRAFLLRRRDALHRRRPTLTRF
jgi:hypothetical protein